MNRRTSVYHNRILGLWRRGAIYQYRVRVPTDLIHRVGATHINRSLKTSELRTARVAVHRVALEIADQFAVLRGEVCNGAARMNAAIVVAAQSPFSPRSDEGPSLDELWNHYLDDPTSVRSAKSRAAYHTVRRLVVAVLGPDLCARQLTHQNCRSVLEILQRLLSNYEKRFPGLSPMKVVQRAKTACIDPMSTANLNGYMEKFSGLELGSR